MNPSAPMTDALRRPQRIGLAAGLAGLIACSAGGFLLPAAFFQGYLTAFVFWTNLSLGCLALLMLHHLVAGEWGFVTQRLLESGALTIGLMAVLFLPLLLGLGTLYPWTDAALVQQDPVLRHKAAYLNTPFFVVRAAVYFACWTGGAWLFRRWSARLDATGDAWYGRRMRGLGAGGLVGFVFLTTFAAVDWVMSIEAHWFSTIYGVLYAVSQGLSALTLLILVVGPLAGYAPLTRVFNAGHLHDLGNLLLAFVILWTYLMFVQYLILWSGNIPEDVVWFLRRGTGVWFWVITALAVFHFAVPFLLLLSRNLKRKQRRIRTIAALLFVMHALYVAWLVLPAFEAGSLAPFGFAAAAFVGIGGFWTVAFCRFLAPHAGPDAPFLPAGDPRLPRTLHLTEDA